MKDIDLVNDNILQLNNETGGSYDYCDWEQDSIMLPEIIVTPDGNYTRDEWDDLFGNDNYPYDDDYPYDDRDDFGHGGPSSDHGNMSQSEITANGLQAVGLVEDSIRNNTAVWLQKAQETNIYKAVSVSSLVANAPGLQNNLIRVLANNQSILNTWGKAFVKGNALVGGATAVIGIADGDATPGDWVLVAGAAAGILGAYTSVCPAVGLTLSGLSIVLTVVGTCMNGNSSNSTY